MDALFILKAQLIYYHLTALWPFVHIKSFMAVTGPKTDIWLVKTISVLLLAIANTLTVAVYLENAESAMAICLSVSCCIGLIAIDIFYVVKRVISKVYLLDALAELMILIAWVSLPDGIFKLIFKI